MQPNVHSKQVLEWIQIWYILRRYDIIDMLDIVARLNRNGYHPTIHGNVTVGLCPKIAKK